MQPPCEDETCYTVAAETPPPNQPMSSAWGWVILIAVIVVLDVVLTRTLSQWTQEQSRKWRWFRFLGVTAFAVLVWHLFWGFPG